MNQKVFCTIIALLTLTFSSCNSKYFTASDKKVVDKVVNWQIQHIADSVAPVTDWVYAALFRGMAEWADEINSKMIYDYLFQVGEKHDWKLLPRVYHADDLCMGQTYLKLYDKYKEDKMIRKVAERVDYVMSHPNTAPLINEKGNFNQDRWGWCDALFMAPPVYAMMYKKTGDEKYLDFCFAEYKATTDSLYDRNAHLFYRDLTLKGSTNSQDKKSFWGRGNGWVYGGLAILLNTVPKDHPSYAYYLNLYKEMTNAILNCQDETGAWHSSLLDKENYPQPENSASGFFVFGLAWGVNNGILTDPSSRKTVIAGWKSLQKYVDNNGKLGYVQPVGYDPRKVTQDMTAPYGVGAYLLAASEMRKMRKK
jgi:rhamnogalacturonyl hydrolase YesR